MGRFVELQPAIEEHVLVFHNEHVKGCHVDTCPDELSAASLFRSALSGNVEFRIAKNGSKEHRLNKITTLRELFPKCFYCDDEFRSLHCIQHCQFGDPKPLEFNKGHSGLWACAIPHAACMKYGYKRFDVVFTLRAEMMVAALLSAGAEQPSELYCDAATAASGIQVPCVLGDLARLCVAALLPDVPLLDTSNDWVFSNRYRS